MSREIILTNCIDKIALVDDEDYAELSKYRWQAEPRHKVWYARAYINRKRVYMHRFILGLQSGEQADHANLNGLDNRRSNIRKCCHGDNQHNQGLKKSNTSGYKGVHYRKDQGKFVAFIRYAGKRQHLGSFSNIDDAVVAYNRAALVLRGIFARPNAMVPNANL